MPARPNPRPADPVPALTARPRSLPRILSLGLSLATTPAFAAHPLQTEDTGTQGAANVEIENGLSQERFGSRTVTVYQPQLSVGLSASIDAIVQPSVAWLHAPGRPMVSGAGDTNLDAKWRFWGRDRWSMAVRGGLSAPTAQDGLGLSDSGSSEHALLVATWHDAPTTVHANVGLTHGPRAPGTRTSVAGLSAALMQAVGDRLVVAVDTGLQQDADASRRTWAGSLLGGVIWTARPGLDLDVGCQRSVNTAAVDRRWLAGLTYRFSLRAPAQRSTVAMRSGE